MKRNRVFLFSQLIVMLAGISAFPGCIVVARSGYHTTGYYEPAEPSETVDVTVRGAVKRLHGPAFANRAAEVCAKVWSSGGEYTRCLPVFTDFEGNFEARFRGNTDFGSVIDTNQSELSLRVNGFTINGDVVHRNLQFLNIGNRNKIFGDMKALFILPGHMLGDNSVPDVNSALAELTPNTGKLPAGVSTLPSVDHPEPAYGVDKEKALSASAAI